MYKPTLWQDHVEGVQEGTDMNAKNFNNIETGVIEAAALAALNAEFSRYKADELAAIADYDVECGTVDGWTYVKKKSGFAECTGTITYTPAEILEPGGELRLTKSLPFTFAAPPDIFVHPSALAYKVRKTYPLTSTSSEVSIYALLESDAGLSTSENIGFRMLIKGRWK